MLDHLINNLVLKNLWLITWLKYYHKNLILYNSNNLEQVLITCQVYF